MAKLQINAVGGIGGSQSLPSDLMERMKEYEANVQKKRKSDAFDSAYNSLVEEYDRYKNGDKKSILSVRDTSDNLLAEIERDRDSYTDIYGEERYSELYSNIKGISDDVRSAMNESLEDAKEKTKAEEEAKNALPEFDRIAFENSLLATQKKQENTPVRNPSEPISPLMQNVMGGVETPIEIPNAHDDRDKLMNAQAAFGKYVEEKKEEGKTIPSVKEEDKPKATFGENALGFAQTASTNLALGAANSISSIVNGLEQAIGDAASGGAYSDGFKVLSDYFGAMPSELRTEVLAELGTEGHPNRPTRIGSVSRATGVSQNVIEQYAKSVQNENMRESVLDSGYAAKMNSALKEHTADIAFSIGQQIPGLMLSGALSGATSATSAVGGVIGANPSTVLIGMSAAGNEAFNLAREKGYNPSIYAEAVMQGGIEMILEGLLGFSDVSSYQKLMTNTGSTVGNVAKSFIKYIVSGAEEGLEEVINVPLSNLTSMMFGGDKKIGFGEGDVFDYKEMIKSGMSGAAVGLVMGGVMGTSMAVSAVKEGADIRYNADWLNKMAQKLPEHYRPATAINASKATEADVENYGKELTRAFNKYMTDSMNGEAVLSNKDKYGEDVASVTEDNSTVQLADQAEVLAHVQAEDTEGAKEIIEQKIQHYTEMAEALADDESLKKISGEGTSEKIASNVARLTETKDMLDAGTYNAAEAQKAISYQMQKKIAEGKKTTTAARQFAETVKSNLGVVQGERAIAHTVELLEADVKNGVANASAQLKVAKKALDSIRKEPSAAVRSLLGNTEKELGKAISDSSKKRSVQFDYSMPEGSYASYNRGTGTVKINPMSVLMAQSQMDSGNKARSEFVHEAGHIAAQMDASFVSKVYDVYTKLRADNVIPENGLVGLNETDIREAYRKDKSLSNYLNTETVKNGIKQLVAQGSTAEQARDSFAEAFLQEEIAMHFLSWAENNGANLYNTIVPEKRNAFVEAMHKIAQFFRDVAAKIRGKDPASAKKMDTLADKLYNAVRDFAGGSTTAQESVNAKTTENTTTTESGVSEGSTGTPEADERKSLDIGGESVVVEDGDTRYSIKSMNHDIAEGKMFDDLVRVGVFNREEADTLRDNLDKLVKYMIPFANIVDMNEEYGQGDRPFRAYKPNSDPLYVISLDFSTLCRKRLMTQYVIEQLQLRENRPMTAEEQIAIRSMLLDYRKQNKALQVACAMCYVEAARLKAPKQMEKFFTDTENILKTYFAKKDKEFNANVRRAQEEFKVSRGYEADTPKSQMKGKDATALNKMSSEMRRGYEPSEEQKTIIETAKSLPRSTFLTAANLTELSIEHPEIYDAYTSHIRASTRSKSLEGDIPYYYGDSEGIVSDTFIDNVNAENGFRFDSWSDFQMKHMLDMITAVIELSVRKSKMHGYTKFPEMVRIFGKTGMMFNLSGVADGVGLDENGNLIFSDVEGMAYEDAIKLRDEFPETAGFQCIGVSNDHIRALLRSDDIDYVIPYHTSGLNATLRRMVKIYGWKDYTGVQNAKKDPNAKKPANAENWQVEPVWSEFFVSDGKNGYDSMKKTAQRYIDMCHERGLIPKFEEFTDEPNYWKLLIDRKMVNQKTGALIEQKAVRPDFDFGLIEDEVKREVSEYDPKLEQDALNYVVDNFDAIGSRIRELKKIAPKKKLQTVGNEVLQAYAEGSKREEVDERKSLATSIYIKDGHTADGEVVDFINLILDGKKKGETRTHKSLTRKWVGIAKDVYVYGRVRFGEPYLIDKDSPEYADSYIEGTEYDIADGEKKYYYPILEVEDFRDAPKPITKHGNYAQYEDGGEDVQKSDVITIGMSDTERARILSGKKVIAPVYNGEADASIDKERNKLNGTIDLAKATLVRIGEEFGVFTSYDVDDIDVQVTFSRGNLHESVFKGADVEQLAKLLPVLRDSVQKAVGVERHENRYYYDTFTTSFSELVGAYVDGEYIVPVRFGLKHLVDGNNTLHIVVGQPSFKIDGKKKTGVIEVDDRQSGGHPTSLPVYEISISQIFANVNTKDLLRYVPDDFLNENQRKIKWDGIADTIKYTNDKNDNKYAEFIRKGNLSAAMSMVAAAAKANGYTIEAWHGSRNSFNSFSREKLGSSTRTKASERWFFAADKETAESYHPYSVMKKLEEKGYWKPGSADSMKQKGELYHLFLKMENPLEVDVAGYDYASHRDNADAFVEYLDQAERDGNDGIILYHVRDNNLNTSAEESTDYLFKEPSQAKSADVIVYDDEGNIIPLSERFNPLNDDIRYSKETTDKRIARLKEDKEFLKQQMEKSRSVALSPADVDKIVKEMREQYGFDKSERDNVKTILGLVDKVVNKKIRPERMDETWDSIVRGARTVLEGVYEVDSSLMKENEAFIKHIRSTPYSVPADNENDFAGGYAEYRNENRKYVNLSRNGTPIDSVYEELCGQYPGVLDSTIGNPVDQIEEIVRVMKAFEPADVPSYADTIDQASQEFANALVSKYLNTAQKTYAQSLRDKADEIRKDNADRRVAAEVNRVQSAADRAENAYKREIEHLHKVSDKRVQQTVTAYEARLNSIESAAARDAKEYERIINRYKQAEEAREFAGDRKEYARRIRQDARALRSAAVSPNSKKFVPEKYRGNVERIAEFLDYVSTGRVNLNSEIAEPWAGIARIRDDFRAVSELYGEDFNGLAMGILHQMEFYTSGLSQMENQDLKTAIFYRDAYKLGRLMRTSIANQNKVYLGGRAMAANVVGAEIKDTLNARKKKQEEFTSLADKQKRGAKLLNAVYNKNLSFTDGYSFFHRMGNVGDRLFETLQGAQSRQVLYMKSYTDTIGEKLKDVDLSKYAGAKQKTIRVTLANGTEYSMTAAQAMSVVTLYERESGKSHIEKGGIQIYNPKTHQLSKATALTEKDIASIRNALDGEDNKVMKVFSDFMRDECTAWGNEATMEKYGFHRFTTANYFPINVNRDATGADMKTYAPDQFNVENVGFAKSAKDDGSAPVIIGSMIDVANTHVNGMATYAAYLNVEDGINRVLKVDGVKDAMRRTLGSDAEKYIVEMMNDLKGARKDSKLADNTVEFMNKMAGRYKAAAVSYNASTVAKQPLSYLRAATVIDNKYLAKGAVGDKKLAYEQMMKYSGIAVRKEIGYSDVGVGKTVGDQIGYTEKGTWGHVTGAFNEFGMKGAALADRVTWEALWIACRAEQAEKNASAAIDEKALMEATAKRFGEVVARTQVVDSALTSAPVSRSNNGLVRLYYAFTSEPIKSYNMLVTAIDDLVNSKDEAARKKAAGHLGRVVACTAVGWAAEAAITSAFQALRDDDDDFFGKISETYLANVLENVGGAIPVIDPLAENIKNLVQGYDVTSMADQPLADIVSDVMALISAQKDGDGKRETEAKVVRDIVESASTLAGIPTKNLFRMVTNLRKFIFHATDNYAAEYKFQSIWYNPKNATAREKNEFNSLLADAYIAGDKEAFEYIYEDMRKMGLKPQQLVNSIAKDAYAGDIAYSNKSTLLKYTPGSDAWYIGMKTIFNRDESAPKATEDEITRVYKASGETSVLPKFKDGEYKVDGVSRWFEGEALDKYLDDYGRLYYEVANAMRDLSAYRNGSAEEQAWWLSTAEKYASAVAVYTQDKDYSVTYVGKWVSDYVSKKPYEVAKYIVSNLEKK